MLLVTHGLAFDILYFQYAANCDCAALKLGSSSFPGSAVTFLKSCYWDGSRWLGTTALENVT